MARLSLYSVSAAAVALALLAPPSQSSDHGTRQRRQRWHPGKP